MNKRVGKSSAVAVLAAASALGFVGTAHADTKPVHSSQGIAPQAPVTVPGDPVNENPFQGSLIQDVWSGDRSEIMKLKDGYTFQSPSTQSGKVAVAKDGAVVGYLDDPYVLDGTSSLQRATWKVSGNSVVLDATNIGGQRRHLDAPVTFSSVTDAPSSNNYFVPIPSGYRYNPKLGTLHDYCSYSPDRWGPVDFRGPCARHDMCYENDANKKSGAAKSAAIRACNYWLKHDMDNNCEAVFGKWDPRRQACYGIATTYYAAVTAKNH